MIAMAVSEPQPLSIGSRASPTSAARSGFPPPVAPTVNLRNFLTCKKMTDRLSDTLRRSEVFLPEWKSKAGLAP